MARPPTADCTFPAAPCPQSPVSRSTGKKQRVSQSVRVCHCPQDHEASGATGAAADAVRTVPRSFLRVPLHARGRRAGGRQARGACPRRTRPSGNQTRARGDTASRNAQPPAHQRTAPTHRFGPAPFRLLFRRRRRRPRVWYACGAAGRGAPRRGRAPTSGPRPHRRRGLPGKEGMNFPGRRAGDEAIGVRLASFAFAWFPRPRRERRPRPRPRCIVRPRRSCGGSPSPVPRERPCRLWARRRPAATDSVHLGVCVAGTPYAFARTSQPPCGELGERTSRVVARGVRSARQRAAATASLTLTCLSVPAL